MEGGIKFLADHFHAGHTLLLEHIHKLFVEALIAAMERLSLLTFRIQLLPSTLEVVHHRQDFTERGADQLLTHVVLVPALTLAEVVEIRCDPHVLALQRLVLLLQGLKLLFQLLQTLSRIRQGCVGGRFSGDNLGLRRCLSRFDRLNGLILRWGGSVAAHADRSEIAV